MQILGGRYNSQIINRNHSSLIKHYVKKLQQTGWQAGRQAGGRAGGRAGSRAAGQAGRCGIVAGNGDVVCACVSVCMWTCVWYSGNKLFLRNVPCVRCFFFRGSAIKCAALRDSRRFSAPNKMSRFRALSALGAFVRRLPYESAVYSWIREGWHDNWRSTRRYRCKLSPFPSSYFAVKNREVQGQLCGFHSVCCHAESCSHRIGIH